MPAFFRTNHKRCSQPQKSNTHGRHITLLTTLAANPYHSIYAASIQVHENPAVVSYPPPSSSQFDCKKTRTGPDPYGVNDTNLWHQQSRILIFAPEDGSSRAAIRPRPFCARSTCFDPYHLSKQNTWLHESQSLRSVTHFKLNSTVTNSRRQTEPKIR